MLVKTTVRGAINKVVFSDLVAAALIKVNPEAAITQAGDVVPEVVADDGSGLFAKRVDAAHVAQDRAIAVGQHANMMNVVELDNVVVGRRRAVTPRPTDGYTRVIEIVNQIIASKFPKLSPIQMPMPLGNIRPPSPMRQSVTVLPNVCSVSLSRQTVRQS